MMPQLFAPARWPWLLACCLAAAGAWFWFQVLAPAQGEVAALEQAAARRVHARPAPAPARRAALPGEATFPDVLGRIADAAARAGIAVDEGSYQVVRLAQERTVRYEITLPLRLAYPQLHAFLDELHAALPAVAVDSIHLQRQKVGDELLDARLKLGLSMEART